MVLRVSALISGVLSAPALSCSENRKSKFSESTATDEGSRCGGAWALVLKCYGRAWRTQRKLLHSQLNAQMSKQYQQIQRESTIRFLQQLVETPADFEKHARL